MRARDSIHSAAILFFRSLRSIGGHTLPRFLPTSSRLLRRLQSFVNDTVAASTIRLSPMATAAPRLLGLFGARHRLSARARWYGCQVICDPVMLSVTSPGPVIRYTVSVNPRHRDSLQRFHPTSSDFISTSPALRRRRWLHPQPRAAAASTSSAPTRLSKSSSRFRT